MPKDPSSEPTSGTRSKPLKAPRGRPGIPAGVWALGFVSLFTDLGSEMVHGLLPVFLAGTLGASAAVIGLIEGVAEAIPLLVRAVSGYFSDALGRRKPLVVLGYGLAAASKPLFPLATSVATVAGARFCDRVGKGIRGAPRDALLSDLSPPGARGASFGLRQSMDTLGAVAGPMVAIGLMLAFDGDIRTVLWFAVIPGVVAVSLLVLAVREPSGTRERTERLPITRDGMASLGGPFWSLVVLGLLMSLARFSEAFLVLRASERGLGETWVPMVLVVMSLVYTLTAYPAGRLSDRVGRTGILVWGMGALVAAHGVLALAASPGIVLVGVGLWGLHLGMTQGILAALVAETAPGRHLGTAFGIMSVVSGVGVLAASLMAGLLWDRFAPPVPFWTGAALAVAALAVAATRRPAGQ